VIKPESVKAEKVALNMAVEVWIHVDVDVIVDVDVDGFNSCRTVQPTNFK
jgi:hypothetical protein